MRNFSHWPISLLILLLVVILFSLLRPDINNLKLINISVLKVLRDEGEVINPDRLTDLQIILSLKEEPG